MTFLDYGVLIGYFALMAAIGFVCMRRVHDQEDYFLGGRGFGKLLQTFAAFGAGTGSGDPVNTGRTTFTSGMSGMWSVMYWLFVTPFYWITAIWYRRMRHTTLGDWFTERYESKRLGATYALFGIFFMVTYGSMMFSAVGKVAAPLVSNELTQPATDTLGIEYKLVPVIGVIVFIYGAAGGLRAAYFTDLVQGICIVLLSILLIPFGLWALVERFGDPDTMGIMDGFRIMHEQVPAEFFSVVGSTNTSEFPLHFIAAVVLINLITVVVQPHFIITGGGSAKDEHSARVGLVVGNFLKRLCTIGWVFTALIALALFANSPELVTDPDKTWGVASRELLGDGFRGLMLACLLAALMSSIDVYMIVGSALVVRNIYVPFINPEANEKQCLRVARITGAVVVGGSVLLSLAMMNVFQQLKLTWIVLVPIAAPFWIGMWWRRATTTAAWFTAGLCLLTFFILPWLIPWATPDLRTSQDFAKLTPFVETISSRLAAPTDVAQRQTAIELWEQRYGQEESAAEVPARPDSLSVGEKLSETQRSGGYSIYWTGPVVPVNAQGELLNEIEPVLVAESKDDESGIVRNERRYAEDVLLMGTGQFRVDYLLFKVLGIDLTSYSKSTLQTLDLLPKIVIPFLVMIIVSLFTRPNSKATLDRYYAKMKTPVVGVPEKDAAELELSYQQPDRFDSKRLFPGTQLEIQTPSRADVIGFAVSLATCFAIIGLAMLIAEIGA